MIPSIPSDIKPKLSIWEPILGGLSVALLVAAALALVFYNGASRRLEIGLFIVFYLLLAWVLQLNEASSLGEDTLGKPLGSRRVGLIPAVVLLPLVPLMLVAAAIAAAVSIPYTKVHNRRMARREDRFRESMMLRGRVIDWADFVGELDQGNGVLIVERFSFKGPIRLWWTRDDLYKTCPYPLVDWFTMTMDTTFDPVRTGFTRGTREIEVKPCS